MSQKKHIDRLFQEKFKDFEATPDAQAWKNIEKELLKKTPSKSKKIIPLWVKISGIAASLILLLTTGIFIFNENNTESITTIDSNKKTPQPAIENPDGNTLETSLDKENENVVQNTSNNKKLENQDYNSTNYSGANSTNNASTKTNSNTAGIPSNNEQNSILNKASETTTLSSNSTNTAKNKYGNETLVVNQNKSSKNNSSKTIGQNTLVNNSATNNTSFRSKIKNTESTRNSNNNKTALNSKLYKEQNSNKVTKTSTSNNNTYSVVNNASESNTNSSYKTSSVYSNTELYGISKPMVLLGPDSISNYSIIIRDAKSIEAAILESERSLKKEKMGPRWSVSPNIAPVYYNSFGGGSQFGSQFNNNSKTGEINTSYGVALGYAVNKKLKIRSGINKVNLSYDTDDVIVFESVSNTKPDSFLNIDFYSSISNEEITVISADNLAIQQINSDSNFNAALSQRISYLEVPVELEYNLSDSRFGVSIIGGFSTFLLENNLVVSEFDDFKTDIGEANNINNVSFSTNIGLGLNYKFSKSFIYIFEPTFKYQINGFSNTSGDFNPYIIGVYTGFSYKF
jgi:hypothetical protein